MVLKAVRDAITSKTTRRVLLNFTLLAGSSLALLFLSILSTAIFFASYVPDKSLTWPVYLQYGLGTHPFGITGLTRPLPKTQQGYDVSISLTLPKSVPESQIGNFMVVLHLLDHDVSSSLATVQLPESGTKLRGVRWILHHYRFPAFITLTLGFWGMEMLFAAVALFLIGLATGSSERSLQADEQENPLSLERSQEKEKQLEHHKSEGDVGQVVSKPDTALRPKEEGQSGESVYDDPARTVRADSDEDVLKEEGDEEKDEKGRFEAKGKEVEQEVKKEEDEDEELVKSLAGDDEDDTRIKVEDDSDI
ncbi:unnamed protein product [Parascedosporium putredinis]|uniref:Seipin n=1 Tax=Parascedosporium putredinis TaxID=1442378 RepID=A0A9P1H3R9_9PEZI|nr:unnamed protein product [Parascedosporium putredinis]CAI7996025.1 unnamed protein product [Parascedosporium putredinis]